MKGREKGQERIEEGEQIKRRSARFDHKIEQIKCDYQVRRLKKRSIPGCFALAIIGAFGVDKTSVIQITALFGEDMDEWLGVLDVARGVIADGLSMTPATDEFFERVARIDSDLDT